MNSTATPRHPRAPHSGVRLLACLALVTASLLPAQTDPATGGP